MLYLYLSCSGEDKNAQSDSCQTQVPVTLQECISKYRHIFTIATKRTVKIVLLKTQKSRKYSMMYILK